MGILRFSNLFNIKAVKGVFLFTAVLFLAKGQAYAGIKETLSKKYPDCAFVEKSKFLTDKEFETIKSKYPTRDIRRFYSFYKRECKNETSYDFVFTDTVRTKNQVLHVHVVKNNIESLAIVKFEEPSEYKVKPNWLSRFKSQRPDTIDIVSGATLSSNSTKFLVWLSLYLQKDII
ncbi:FMN-binding protein [Halobacteriovorax sp. ZH4_bin.1]|uniref:FMN-binding protein n=1 Tax=unclassified Halobacteriovorax TaxID=2639665 RepID=UPI00371A571C